MEPIKVKDLLDRYKELSPPDESVRKKTIDAIKNYCGTQLSMKNVSIRNNVVYISARPAIRNSVQLHKQDILQELHKNLPNSAPREIR